MKSRVQPSYYEDKGETSEQSFAEALDFRHALADKAAVAAYTDERRKANNPDDICSSSGESVDDQELPRFFYEGIPKFTAIAVNNNPPQQQQQQQPNTLNNNNEDSYFQPPQHQPSWQWQQQQENSNHNNHHLMNQLESISASPIERGSPHPFGSSFTQSEDKHIIHEEAAIDEEDESNNSRVEASEISQIKQYLNKKNVTKQQTSGANQDDKENDGSDADDIDDSNLDFGDRIFIRKPQPPAREQIEDLKIDDQKQSLNHENSYHNDYDDREQQDNRVQEQLYQEDNRDQKFNHNYQSSADHDNDDDDIEQYLQQEKIVLEQQRNKDQLLAEQQSRVEKHNQRKTDTPQQRSSPRLHVLESPQQIEYLPIQSIQMSLQDSTQPVFEGLVWKYKPGVAFNFVQRYLTISRDCLKYFKDKVHSKCYSEKPLYQVSMRHVLEVARVKFTVPLLPGEVKREMKMAKNIAKSASAPGHGNHCFEVLLDNYKSQQQGEHNHTTSHLMPEVRAQKLHKKPIAESSRSNASKKEGEIKKDITDLITWTGRSQEWYEQEERLLFSSQNKREIDTWVAAANWVLQQQKKEDETA